MGHKPLHISATYRERISDERLKAVSDHFRKWLFREEEGAEATSGRTTVSDAARQQPDGTRR